MKNLYIAFFVIITSLGYSQDTIVKTNREFVVALVKEISINEITYQKFENLDGPLYIISKKDVSRIVFKNRTSELYIKDNVEAKRSVNTLKEVIVEYINKYGYGYSFHNQYNASFEGNYLKLTRIHKKTNELYPSSKLYDFSGDCNIHLLSLKNDGFGYINAYVPVIRGKSVRDGYKLVIRVKGHENAKILDDALREYNGLFN